MASKRYVIVKTEKDVTKGLKHIVSKSMQLNKEKLEDLITKCNYYSYKSGSKYLYEVVETEKAEDIINNELRDDGKYKYVNILISVEDDILGMFNLKGEFVGKDYELSALDFRFVFIENFADMKTEADIVYPLFARDEWGKSCIIYHKVNDGFKSFLGIHRRTYMIIYHENIKEYCKDRNNLRKWIKDLFCKNISDGIKNIPGFMETLKTTKPVIKLKYKEK